MAKYYITTPIYYVNDVAHLGHAYTTIAADILSRWHKSSGDDVFFLTGTDEHGLKIQRSAEAAGKEPKEFVESIVLKWKKLFADLKIEYSYFIRTTDQQHEEAVQRFIKKVSKDIYKGIYEGLYCVDCEAYYTEKDLIDGKLCAIHKKQVQALKEESYFFKLSKYQNKLLEIYKRNPKLISPAHRKDEILNRIKDGLKDISISRASFDWGVPFPLDKKHVTYVWFDALLNYISALGWPGGDFKRYWPADIQLMGKEILWFHTAIWHAMLLSAGIRLPKMEFAHGWWTVDGQKMSKTLGNVIDPKKIADKHGLDSFRYVLFRSIPFGEDGDFSEKMLVERLNSDLADNLGNLLSRSLTLIEKFSAGAVPKGRPDANLKKGFTKTFKEVKKDIDAVELHHALEKVFSFISRANKYVNDEAPWELAKNKKVKELNNVLYNLAESLRVISALVYPFIPESGEKIAKQLGFEAVPKLEKIKYGQTKAGIKINKGEILFRKVEKFEPEVFGQKEMISKVDLRVAEIKS